eukprot:CAMPEP_0168575092 /NCGR_PEP_ID=MMETSP0413-20121227/19461_1 /TAXON_ID=136452 /ORGANISM="Filamoeba nolandi, Strain NC-AS-23-1" /LENGTH=260 /DNA_ID=CAMNT_0008608541 /DNA_START=340 /DNA_END=1122 /DNA_ORIENTATION=-
MASSSLDNYVLVCDLTTDTLLHRLEGHHKPVNCMQIDIEQDLLVTAGVDGIVKLWSISTGECLHTLQGHKDEICCMKQKGRWIVTGSHDKYVRVWRTSGESLHELYGHVSGDRHGAVCVWNLHDGTFLGTVRTESICEICCLEFDLETLSCVFTTSDGRVTRYDVISQVATRAESRHENIAYAMHWSKPQNRLITAGYDGAVLVWDTSDNGLKYCNKIDFGSEKFFWMEVSPSNRFVVLASRTKQIFVLNFLEAKSVESH